MSIICRTCNLSIEQEDAVAVEIDEGFPEQVHFDCAQEYWCSTHEDYCAGRCDAEESPSDRLGQRERKQLMLFALYTRQHHDRCRICDVYLRKGAPHHKMCTLHLTDMPKMDKMETELELLAEIWRREGYDADKV